MKLSTVARNDVQILGEVSGVSVYGIGIITSIVYSFCAFFGLECRLYAKKIAKAKESAKAEMTVAARGIGADGVMGVSCQLSLLSVLVYGTAYRETSAAAEGEGLPEQ